MVLSRGRNERQQKTSHTPLVSLFVRGGISSRWLFCPFSFDTKTQGHWVSPAPSCKQDQEGLRSGGERSLHVVSMRIRGYSETPRTMQEEPPHEGGCFFFLNLIIVSSLLSCSSVPGNHCKNSNLYKWVVVLLLELINLGLNVQETRRDGNGWSWVACSLKRVQRMLSPRNLFCTDGGNRIQESLGVSALESDHLKPTRSPDTFLWSSGNNYYVSFYLSPFSPTK